LDDKLSIANKTLRPSLNAKFYRAGLLANKNGNCGIRNNRRTLIRKIQFSKALMWDLIGCVGKYECKSGR
jgi:hypothetical protein